MRPARAPRTYPAPRPSTNTNFFMKTPIVRRYAIDRSIGRRQATQQA
ncbi:hypothetical protein ACFPRL_15750 [Pseudoclavibacter helvolus]